MPDALSASALRGRRILVVEDEYMLAEDLQYDLKRAHAEVIGPVPSVADALNSVRAGDGYDHWALPEAYKDVPAAISPSTCATLPERCSTEGSTGCRLLV